MDEFVKENYSLITYSVEFIAVLTGLILLRKYKNTHAKAIIFFLIYAFLVDFIGSYPSILYKNNLFHLIEDTLIERNYWWYAIFWWVGLSVFMVLINYKVVSNDSLKKILKYSLYVYLLQVLLCLIFRFELIFKPDEQFLKIASFWIVVLSIVVYLFEILRSEKIVLFYKSLYFYLNIIMFLWILVMIPMDFFEVYFRSDDWNYIILKYKIYLSLNIFLYLSISAALVFCKPETK
ncbi:hypothetical protein [Winogradskyella flava]|uniref:hypothetical protein n=1 Tax=Winogradskyella flava TaxID=1884876 RepID=UPI002490DFB8|nr:hypothetical protein [Winogradskyella flava]